MRQGCWKKISTSFSAKRREVGTLRFFAFLRIEAIAVISRLPAKNVFTNQGERCMIEKDALKSEEVIEAC